MKLDVDYDKTSKCPDCGGIMEEQYDPFKNEDTQLCLRCSKKIVLLSLRR